MWCARVKLGSEHAVGKPIASELATAQRARGRTAQPRLGAATAVQAGLTNLVRLG